MLKERILILVGIPHFNYSDPNSAVLSFLNQIKHALIEEGHTVDLSGNEEQTAVNTESTSLQQRGVAGLIKKQLKKWPWLYQSIALKRYFKNQENLLNQLLKREPYDRVIEFHTMGSVVGAELKKKWSCKLSVIFDSPVAEQFYEMHETKTLHWLKIERSEQKTMEASDRIMAYSPACKNYLLEKYKINAEVNILPCVVTKTVAPVNREANNSEFNIGFIGSFLKWHNVSALVEVFSNISKELPAVKLYLVGYGMEWNNVKDLVQKLGLEKKVFMPGFVSESELMAIKQKLSVAVMPGSNWYGSPLKLFEYAEASIPFIAPKTPTVSSIFTEKEHCLYINPNQPKESLRNSLLKLHQEVDFAHKMAENAKKMVQEKYGTKPYSKKLIDTLVG